MHSVQTGCNLQSRQHPMICCCTCVAHVAGSTLPGSAPVPSMRTTVWSLVVFRSLCTARCTRHMFLTSSHFAWVQQAVAGRGQSPHITVPSLASASTPSLASMGSIRDSFSFFFFFFLPPRAPPRGETLCSWRSACATRWWVTLGLGEHRVRDRGLCSSVPIAADVVDATCKSLG